MSRTAPALALLLCGLAPAAVSAEPAPADAYAYRHALFENLGGHMKQISMIVRGKAGGVDDLYAHAIAVHESAKTIPAAFPKGTGKEVVAETRALASVWDDPKGFEAAAQRLVDASAKLVDAAREKDLAAVKARLGAVGQSCGGCHEGFRAEEK